MLLISTYYTQQRDDLYTQSQRDFNESKTTYSLYNGALDPNEDPADYHAPTKAVYVS